MEEIERIIALSNAFGPSGFEDEVSDLVKDELSWLEPEEDGFTGIYYMPEDWLEEIVVGWDAYYEGTEQPYYFAMDAYGR